MSFPSPSSPSPALTPSNGGNLDISDEMTVRVTGKLEAMLECAHRPLRTGERAKRRGQNTVFEATGSLSPSASSLMAELRSGALSLRATVKHDGQCLRLRTTRGQDGYVTAALYRRLDVRTGDASGHVDAEQLDDADEGMRWVRVDNALRPDDVYARSALHVDSAGRLVSLAMVRADPHNAAVHVFDEAVPTSALPSDATYELVGPRVQGDPYALASSSPLVEVHVDATHVRKVPRHWLVMHGAIEVALPPWWTAPVDSDYVERVRNFIVAARIEGVVLQFRDVKTRGLRAMLKVNRGHIGVEHNSKDHGALRLSLEPPA